MFKTIVLVFAAVILTSCEDDKITPPESACSTPATVVDLTGLDGCGFVLELEDGTRLIPLRTFYCGTPPLPEPLPVDPLTDFEFVAGKKVFIDYTLSTALYAGTCMAGKFAHITCISEARVATSDL